ncbi:unnamed protein product, partial [Symbiodinium necroappetens]
AEKWILDGSVGPGPAAYAPNHGAGSQALGAGGCSAVAGEFWRVARMILSESYSRQLFQKSGRHGHASSQLAPPDCRSEGLAGLLDGWAGQGQIAFDGTWPRSLWPSAKHIEGQSRKVGRFSQFATQERSLRRRQRPKSRPQLHAWRGTSWTALQHRSSTGGCQAHAGQVARTKDSVWLLRLPEVCGVTNRKAIETFDVLE